MANPGSVAVPSICSARSFFFSRVFPSWSLDFVSDQLGDGRCFRVLVVIDDFTRECLALVVDRSVSGDRVARDLEALVTEHGKLLMIVNDNIAELTFRTIRKMARAAKRRLPHHRAKSG